MEDILTCTMGLDVHRDVIVACLIKGELNQKPEVEIRNFSTLRPDMENLKKWVLEQECKNVAMESTGIYWQPIYEILEDCFDEEINILVVNARHMKNVPGKKTDMRDSQWIATLLRAGLLRGSFIPAKSFRELRHLTRYRKSIVRDITSQKNRIDKLLQSSGFRLSAFISDVFGASGRNIIRHLFTHGSITKEELDKCLRTKTRAKIDQILTAVNGSLSKHQQDFLRLMFEHLEQIEAHKKVIEASIDNEIATHSEALALLCSIPGIDVTAASAIIAEIGTNMEFFPSSQHICSWAGLSPGNNESAGKRKSCHITKGNPYLKSMLCEIAWVIAGKRNTYLANWYWRLKSQKGAKRATIALARKILVVIFNMLKNLVPYDDSNYETLRLKCQKRKTDRFISELTKLGYQVVAPC
ncbi:MAG: IS110 family transposase [Peptococcaceae bacterium]|nr:IS110 family transposase [Peptococcaceae bacterium]